MSTCCKLMNQDFFFFGRNIKFKLIKPKIRCQSEQWETRENEQILFFSSACFPTELGRVGASIETRWAAPGPSAVRAEGGVAMARGWHAPGRFTQYLIAWSCSSVGSSSRWAEFTLNNDELAMFRLRAGQLIDVEGKTEAHVFQFYTTANYVTILNVWVTIAPYPKSFVNDWMALSWDVTICFRTIYCF